ncbi:MAG: hypothetical protein AAB969_00520 [Patescibacteria group bacterium]
MPDQDIPDQEVCGPLNEIGIGTDFVEIPHYKWPTVSIGIESIYGMCGLVGPLAELGFHRQEKESDKALAKRIIREFKKLLLKELKSNEPYREHFEQRQAQKT